VPVEPVPSSSPQAASNRQPAKATVAAVVILDRRDRIVSPQVVWFVLFVVLVVR
jgi:hypothetical protein